MDINYILNWLEDLSTSLEQPRVDKDWEVISTERLYDNLGKHLAQLNEFLQKWATGPGGFVDAKDALRELIGQSPELHQDIERWVVINVLSDEEARLCESVSKTLNQFMWTLDENGNVIEPLMEELMEYYDDQFDQHS